MMDKYVKNVIKRQLLSGGEYNYYKNKVILGKLSLNVAGIYAKNCYLT